MFLEMATLISCGVISGNFLTISWDSCDVVFCKIKSRNKTFIAMMEDLGFDVELHYVEREESK